MDQDRVVFHSPAATWEEALPLGNGRFGAMLYGDTGAERIQLNEDSVWYGGPMERNNPDAQFFLPRFREAVLNGRMNEAKEIAFHAFSGTPQSMRQYQSLGDLTIYSDNDEVTLYERCLSFSDAVHRVTFCKNGYHYSREQFISAPAQVMVLRYQTDAPDGINMTPLLTRSRYYDYSGKAESVLPTVMLGGNLGKGGSDFCMMLQAIRTGGSAEVIGERLVIRGASEVVLLLTAGTTYRLSAEISEKERIPVLKDRLLGILEKASGRVYGDLLSEHIAEYQRLYGRVKLELIVDGTGDGDTAKEKSVGSITDSEIKNQTDADFTVRYFNFGRYLMISSSRPGSLPITLQGLWNKDYLPAWDSKYTININTEMNYWPAEVLNLSECHLPLFDLLGKIAVNGAVTAKKMYGCRGIVAHHNTDIWGDTAVQDIWEPASYWVMGAAWLCTHQWTHYLYTKDKDFLREQYPIMREAAAFYIDFLIEDDGFLKTCPSVSPENTFILPNGEKGCLTAGSTMDNQILRDLMTQVLKAAELLEVEEPLQPEFERILKKIAPNRIGSDGRLMEWSKEYEEAEPGHRHISHLYGLHPSHQISPDKTPELSEAACKTLQHRLKNGGGHTGWSRAWIINMYARLHDGDAAYENLIQLLEQSTLPNLFDNHPPFQIDGNFGGISGIAEMLIQSDEDRTIILPALPTVWTRGSAEGFRIVGGGTISIAWENRELTKCLLHADGDSVFHLHYRDREIYIPVKAEETVDVYSGFLADKKEGKG